MNALAQSQYCIQQANALNLAISSAVSKVTGAAALGVTGYLLSEIKKKKQIKKQLVEEKLEKLKIQKLKSKKTRKARKVRKS